MTQLAEFWAMIWPQLGEGLLGTLKLSGGALLIGFVIGLPTSLARVYGPKWLKSIM